MKENNYFYIGYIKEMSATLWVWLKHRLYIILSLTLLSCIVFSFFQSTFHVGAFNVFKEQEFKGIISANPYPHIIIKRPGQMFKNNVKNSRYLIVNPGKHGSKDALTLFHGKEVSINGKLIYRDSETMIEIVPNSVKVLNERHIDNESFLSEGIFLSHTIVTGEIVDSKCFFGVMNPGNFKPHKSCAILCIKGGIPPVFYVKGESSDTYFVLTDLENNPINEMILNHIAVPVKLEGDIYRLDNLLIFRIDFNRFNKGDV